MEQQQLPAAAATPVEQVAPAAESMQEQFSYTSVVEKIKSSKDRLFEVGLYGGIGFLSGFLLKKYSTYVAVLILMLIGLAVLQQLEVINIIVNWQKVYEVFGIQAAMDVTADNIITIAWEWIKVNLVISVSYVIGLFIGLKLG